MSSDPISPPETLLFLRAPRFGTVKSRIAATAGPAVALRAQVCILDHLLTALRHGPPLTLCVTPDDAVDELRSRIQPRWKVVQQGDGDLGVRLDRATRNALEHSTSGVVVIGSDCPEVTPQDLRDAHAALKTSDVVIGPARDGGYWLIGIRRPCPILFSGIDWGTDTVLGTTLRCAQEAGLSVTRLRTLGDIDTEADWLEWNRHRSFPSAPQPCQRSSPP